MHWAHRVASRFPDGQLYVNLHGFDPSRQPVEPADAIRGLLGALGVPGKKMPADLDALAALYRSRLAGKRVLVALDNALSADQIRPLLPGTPGCLVVATSRNQLTSLVVNEGARPLVLDLLDADTARDLLVGRLGEARVRAEPAAVAEIIDRCAGLPLALAIVAARAAHQPGLPLSALAAELTDDQVRLTALDGGDSGTDIRAVLGWSYQRLSPSAARLFRLLGLHPGPDASVAAAASLAATNPQRVRPVLAELVRANLITEAHHGRYRAHDLLRAYAAELAERDESAHARDAARLRLCEHYIHSGYAASALLNPHRDIPLDPPGAGVHPETPDDQSAAMTWFQLEHPVALGLIRLAGEHGLDTQTWQLAWTLAYFFELGGRWPELLSSQEAAVAAGHHLGDPTVQARAHRMVAYVQIRLDRYDDARHNLQCALRLTEGDAVGQARNHLKLAQLYERQDRHEDAVHHCQLAVELYSSADHRVGHAYALNGLSWCCTRLGRHEQALGHAEHALALYREAQHVAGEAGALDSIGFAHHHLGHHAEASTCFRKAIDLHRAAGNRYLEAETLVHLGDAEQAAGAHAEARQAWRQAVRILDELGHDETAADVRTRLDASGATTPP